MYFLPFLNLLFITGGYKMSVEVNSKKLDQIKQAIVDGVREKLTVNKGLIIEKELAAGAINITSAILKGPDHISIDCNIVLSKEAINNYGTPAPVEVNDKEAAKVNDKEPIKHTHKKTDKTDKQ